MLGAHQERLGVHRLQRSLASPTREGEIAGSRAAVLVFPPPDPTHTVSAVAAGSSSPTDSPTHIELLWLGTLT